jgi:hypothetical protein
MKRSRGQNAILLAFALSAVLLLGACNWRPYAYTRGIRQFTGKKMRTHTIAANRSDLSHYQVLEVKKLDNLVLGQIPSPMERYLNDRIYAYLKSLKLFPEVAREGYDFVIEDPSVKTAAKPTVIFEGAIDDYEPGYRSLRFAELGFNHVAVTVRFQLRDKQTQEILSSSSITAQDDTPTGSTKSAENRVAKRIRKLVAAEYRGRR